ncbi:MAG: hypothetical protein PWQ55_635 [Chloroflexota bacterium]|nr:hypothetical protein [Chloroflexota bacterium]
MEFLDIEISKLNFSSEHIKDVIILLSRYLCGNDVVDVEKFNSDELKIIIKYIKELESGGSQIGLEQFNEILLHCHLNTIGNGFYEFFFINGKETEKRFITFNDLIKGITYFRGLSMLTFGNFEFSFEKCRSLSFEELFSTFFPYCIDSSVAENKYLTRPNPILNIENIDKGKTWLLGYISNSKIEKDSNKLQEIKKTEGSLSSENQKLFNRLEELKKNREDSEKRGLENTNIYLAWDFLDIYFATSMREKWDYEETYSFIRDIFSSEFYINEEKKNIKNLRLRVFDPTQSTSNHPYNKGLIEGLMLKRCKLAVYMGQEVDTLGKDSELAATLAQKKPVIAYFPLINPDEYWKELAERPLEYFINRVYRLNAEKVFDQKKKEIIKRFEIINEDFLLILGDFIDEINLFLKKECPFTLDEEREKVFKNRKQKVRKEIKKGEYQEIEYDFEQICRLLAVAEEINFNKRAYVLGRNHPLSMQIDQNTGVAIGILIARTPAQCAELIYRLFTNSCKYSIIHYFIHGVREDIKSKDINDEQKEFSKLIKQLDSNNLSHIARKFDYSQDREAVYLTEILTEEEIGCLKEILKKDVTIPFSIRRHLNTLEINGLTLLEEEITKCAYRAVTDNKKISNSFWNLFTSKEE